MTSEIYGNNWVKTYLFFLLSWLIYI